MRKGGKGGWEGEGEDGGGDGGNERWVSKGKVSVSTWSSSNIPLCSVLLYYHRTE